MVPHLREIWIIFIGFTLLLLFLPSVSSDINIKQTGTTTTSNFWNIPDFSALTSNVYTTCTNSSTPSTYVSFTVPNSDSSSALTLRVRTIFDYTTFGNSPYVIFYHHDNSYDFTIDDAESCNFFEYATSSVMATDSFVLVEPNHTLEIFLSGPSVASSGDYVIEVTQVQQTTLTTASTSFWKYPNTSSCSPQSTGVVPVSKFQLDSGICDPCDISLISFANSSTSPVFAIYQTSPSTFGSTINTCQSNFVQAVTSTTQTATLTNFDLTTSTYTLLSSLAGNDTAYLGLSVAPSLYGSTTTSQRSWNAPVVPQGQQQPSCVAGPSTAPFQSYLFKVHNSDTYFFDTLPVPTEAPFDAALYLYTGRITGTPSCSQFVKAGDSGNGGAIVVDLTPGNYTLVVSSRIGTSSGSYLLHGLSTEVVNFQLIPYSSPSSSSSPSPAPVSSASSSPTTGAGTTTGSATPTSAPSTSSATPSPIPTPSVAASGSATTGAATTQGTTSGSSTTGAGGTTTQGATSTPTAEPSTTLAASQTSSSASETNVSLHMIIIIVAAVGGSAALGLLIGLIMFMRRKRNNKKGKDVEEVAPAPPKEVDGEYTPMEPIQRDPAVEINQHRMSETPSGSAVTSGNYSHHKTADSDPTTSTCSSGQTTDSLKRTRKDTHHIYGNVILDDPNRLKFILDRDMVICEKLGDGFFGEVYRGIWKGREVALKSFKEEDDDPTAFLNEAKLLQKLENPNIVSFLGIFLGTNRRRYIVMEYMNGGSLHKFLMLKKNLVTVPDLVEMAIQAASGMVFLESQSVVHRDLALRNLLVSFTDAVTERDRKSTPRRGSLLSQDTRWSVKVADFGLSRRADPGFYTSQTRTIPVKWSAPEVLLYETYNYTSKCDVWSFGVVLWELFSLGITPYPGLSNSETIDHIQSGYRMPKPKQCPDSVYNIMLHCWEYEPEQRPSFAEIHQQLQQALKELNEQTNATNNEDDIQNTNARS